MPKRLVVNANLISPVSPQTVIRNKLTNAFICVKLFYIPHGVMTFAPQQTWKNYSEPFHLFQTKVGAHGEEYTLVAKGKTATKALKLLKEWAAKVVTLGPVRCTCYRDTMQIELLENFEIRQRDADSTKKELERQQLKRYSLKSLIHKEDKTKLALLPCAINIISEVKHDRTGNVYRATRVIDEEGNSVNLMIWGTLAEKKYLWQSGTIIEMMVVA